MMSVIMTMMIITREEMAKKKAKLEAEQSRRGGTYR